MKYTNLADLAENVTHGDRVRVKSPYSLDPNPVIGKITIEDRMLYFCSDNYKLRGTPCKDKQGYKYSWKLYSDTFGGTINWVELLKEDDYEVY